MGNSRSIATSRIYRAELAAAACYRMVQVPEHFC
jgi:hypothetical protein